VLWIATRASSFLLSFLVDDGMFFGGKFLTKKVGFEEATEEKSFSYLSLSIIF